jgi:4-amino-4-deoxy-L-arabinose transferase-like glycosyltransferase
MTRAALRCAAPALVLAAAILLPFLGKAFTMDDTMFLRQAEHLLSDPLHPTAFEMVWSSAAAPVRNSAIMPSGPAMAYLLVPCVRLGGTEWVAHLTQLLLFWLAILATAGLALRLGLDPAGARAASFLLAATPAALAMAGTAMPDVPAMAFGVVGMERFFAWRDGHRWQQGVSAALAFALSALARPHLILLLGIAALALPGDFLTRRSWQETRRTAWLPLVAAPLLVVAAVFATHDPAASPIAMAGAAGTFSSPYLIPGNFVAFATHWTLVMPLALPWAVLRWRVLLRQPFLYIVTITAGYLLLYILPAEGMSHHAFLIAPAAGLGAGVLLDVLGEGWRRRDAIQIVLGLSLLIALPVVIYIHMPSKYLLASAPTASILVGRALAARSRTLSRAILGATVVAGVVLGLFIIRADAAFSELGRRAANELIAPQVAAGRFVWFAGHFGFQWYAEKAGARCLTMTPPLPLRGDLAVSSLNSFGYAINLFPKRKLLATLEDSTPGGRIMDKSLGSGFYSNPWGYLPWAWGDDVLDRFSLWQLE